MTFLYHSQRYSTIVQSCMRLRGLILLGQSGKKSEIFLHVIPLATFDLGSIFSDGHQVLVSEIISHM